MGRIDTEKQERTKTATKLAAGRYWVGDPCYAFMVDHEHWMNWLHEAWRDTDPNRVKLLDGLARGARVVACGTKYGDGVYQDQDGNDYPVDAGLIGAVHADHWVLDGREPDGMHLVEFDEPFDVSCSGGVIRIGHIEIDTDEGPWN